MQLAPLGSSHERGRPWQPRRGVPLRAASTCSQRCIGLLKRPVRSMLWLLLSANWWLVVHMVDGSHAAGNVCGVGEAWEGVGGAGRVPGGECIAVTATRPQWYRRRLREFVVPYG